MSKPLVIVTRPEEDAPPLVAALDAIGCDALLAPMIEIAPVEPAPVVALDGVQAFLITSANGVRALAAALGPPPSGRGIAVLAVGEASAAAAKQAEFAVVEAAGGDVEALAALVAQRCNPAHGRLVHAAGRTVAGDLKGTLEAKGFTVERLVLYDAVPVAALPAEAADALHDERCFGVLFFSPRTAETFVTLAKQAGLGDAAPHLAALCLSEAVAKAARALDWQRVVVARRPEQAALVEALRDALKAEAPTGRPEWKAEERGHGMAEDGTPAASGEARPEPAHAEQATRPAFRRGAISWAVSALVLAAIGGGLYAAWPSITGRDGTPAPVVEETPAPPEAEAPPEVPAEEAPPAEPAQAEPPSVEPPPETPAPVASDVGAPAVPDDELAALRDRLAALEREAAAPSPADSVAPEELAALNERLGRLEQEAAVRPGDGTPGADAELTARLATLERRVAAAEETTAEAAALRERLGGVQDEAAALSERVATLESQAREDVRLIALVEAKAALAAAAREGAALDHEIEDLRALLPADAPLKDQLDTLAGAAEAGVPGYAALQARFPALAREIVKAEATPGEEAGWVDQTVARLGNIVTVRKMGGALEPGSVDERLVRAEQALAEHDGAAARAALDTLEGGEALHAYRAELERRIALDEAVRAIERYVTGLAAARVVPPAGDGP
ncbi:MAG: uroporphyrinogen-III synthase [Alphaproteobacteria bacterium]